ncbi:CHRD domain-containing protein [Neolewinella aurantiaca]|uniref:CHRD domain-containing protein n=1 Tax=Neolewinella aurantiaca TaxID=2602767 RepID=A0A5C7FLE5_9BACT|nr:CHRD domain-containing protein [Neolewinella aurantiaca]TXF91527.1 CHRD domain-containing protein [Neolewinella aurantiaca]
MIEKHYPNYRRILLVALFGALLLPLGAFSGYPGAGNDGGTAGGNSSCPDAEGQNAVVVSSPESISFNISAGQQAMMDGDFEAALSGLNELPSPVTTTGRGMVTATLTGTTLTVSGSFSGLISDFDPTVAGGAHLHLGMAGEAGPVAFLLTTDLDDDLRGGSFSAGDNTFELTDDEVQALTDRGIYVNIHSVDFGAGELRGQLLPAGADDYNVAYLLGANEVPSVITPAAGALLLERTGTTITVSGSFSGLTGTIATDIAGGAHIHTGVAGRNGEVIIPLNLTIGDDMKSATLEAADNVFELTPEQVEAFDNGGLYVNIHSNAARSGELRGQVADMSVTQFYSNPSGHQTRPVAINTPGNGRLMMTLDAENNLVVSGSVSDLQGGVDLGVAGGAHIHEALAGSSGPIAFGLTITLDDDGIGGVWEPANNTFALTEEEVENFYARRYYVNVHTTAEGSGEVRGQVMNLAKAYFGSNLAGINENLDAVKTPGNGFVIYEGYEDNIVVTGSFADLESNFNANIAGGSHIHIGDATTGGDIVAGLNADVAANLRSGAYEAADNKIMLDSAGYAALIAGNYYFNLHTVNNPTGEIRGQILRDDNAFPTTADIIVPEDGATVTVTSVGSDLEDGRFFAASDPDGDIVVYTIEIAFVNDIEFTNILQCRKVATDTSSNATIESIYQTLLDFGAGPGTTVSLRYRIVSSDGSVATNGDSRTITLIIGDEPDCEITGRSLNLADGGFSAVICADDGVPDLIRVVVSDPMGEDPLTYLVVDADGTILDVPTSQPLNFEGIGGVSRIYAVVHDGSLTGAFVGGTLAELDGCFALSNPVTITGQTGDECGNRRVVINEIDRDGMLELINLGEFNTNAGELYLTNGTDFFLISDLAVVCGELLLMPGDQVTVDASAIITVAADELGLLRGQTLASTEGVYSYVAWGGVETTFEDVAVGAGIWTAGTEVGAPNSAVSVQRIPSQENSYALGAPTLCAPNTLTTATNEPAADQVAVYPNPFGDVLVLEVSGLRSARTELHLLDVTGRSVLVRQLDQFTGQLELPTSQLAAGAYLVRLTNEAGVSAVRVIRR